MERVELVILVGIQASGKTTYYRRYMENDYRHVSLDNWRGKGNIRKKEYDAIVAGLREVAASGGEKRGLVVDNTNTTAATRRRYFDYALEFFRNTGCLVWMIAYFFDEDLESCLKRNAERPKDVAPGTPYYVPPEAIASFQQRLEPPTHEEGFQKVFRVRITEEGGFRVEEMKA
jgi:predicted kinase